MLRDVFYYGNKPNVHPREKFATSLEDARQQSTTEHFWIINEYCDYQNFDWDFDFEFLPDEDVWAEEHNNVWPSQHQKDSGTWLCPSRLSEVIVYRADVDPVKRKNIKSDNWILLDLVDELKFDFSWHPDPTDPPYIYTWGCKFFPVELQACLKYHVPGATDTKFMTGITELLPQKDRWIEVQEIDKSKFDMSWRPDPLDPPMIYIWGNKYIEGSLQSTLEYHTPGATVTKYMPTFLSVEPELDKWVELQAVDKTKFDFSWRPDPREPAYIYTWGNKCIDAELIPTLEYHAPGATERKYMTNDVIVLPELDKWVELQAVDKTKFDFSWRPDPREPAFIYVWGSKWYEATIDPVIEYHAPGATDRKYMPDKIELLPNKINWDIPIDIDIISFDFSWRPNPTNPPYIYQFGTQWQKTGGPKYVVKGATEIKYVEVHKAKKLPSKKHWVNTNQSNTKSFDYSWHPDETAPPYTYQFGTLLDKEDGPRYISPNTNGEIVYLERILEDVEEMMETIPRYIITTTLEDLVKQHPKEIFWALNKNIDYSSFDFDWRPKIVNVQWENEYVYVFGSPDSEITQTYFVNSSMYLKGNTDFKFVENEIITEKYLTTLFKKSDVFFVDRSNHESKERFDKLKQQFPNIQKTRYLNSWVDTISRCINRSTTELCWILNSELDYSEFDFEYYPNPWQMKMIHVFGTQWSHWGTTFMVNRETFAQDTKYIKIIEHLSCLNFVKDRKAKATNVLYDIVYIDHGNVSASTLEGKTVIKYQNSYIATFQKLLDILPVKKEHYVWIASTVCDYSDFDFTYICDPFAKEQLHVFPSDRQKFGDTFLVDVNKLRTLIEDMNVLEDYLKINYNQSQRAKRLPAPIIFTESDTHVSTINSDFDFPYATFITADNKDISIVDTEPMSLWTPESKNIQITSVGGTRIVVPKEAKAYIKRELYDYPYIITNTRLAKSSPMDIVFLSNGEIGAEENYQHLLKVTEGLPNRVTRVDGVNGRVAAYHAAANASNTPWLFTVFAKLKVSNKFDWNWQPDRLQLPKHYVFYATNPVNGLKYGSMAMIAYNKKLTLANQGKGIDFTMDDEHEVLEINSGIANFNTDEWTTWRTAFREALKLYAENSEISNYRLEMWLTVGMGKFSQYSIEGAQHAVEYYKEVNGDFDKFKLSYDWPWLKTYYENKYNL